VQPVMIVWLFEGALWRREERKALWKGLH
jgi:hypothetical protein